jgi:UDP-N-acetylenolpyruvoylglucosamine reductase
VQPADLPNALTRQLSSGAAVGQPAPKLCFTGAGSVDAYARTFCRDLDLWQGLQGQLSPGSILRLQEPLGPKTTLRVGGPAKWYVEPAEVLDLPKLHDFAEKQQLPVFLLGRGSNLIVPETGFNGLVVHLRSSAFTVLEATGAGEICAGAGVRLKQLCGFAARVGCPGFEFLEGIPGMVGGSLKMNAGAMGGWIFDLVASVNVWDPARGLVTLPRAEFNAGYRSCPELEGVTVVSAVFKAASATGSSPQKILEQTGAYASRRKASQPREPSAGCVFKNPPEGAAGAWVEALGLKGKRCGGAMISPIHGNFVVNAGGASTADVLSLIKAAWEAVHQHYGVALEPEPILLGMDWDQVLRRPQSDLNTTPHT